MPLAIRSLQAAATLIALLAVLVEGQTPAYQGALLIEPGLDSRKCMTATSNVNGAAVTLETCTGADSQHWTFNSGSVKVFGNMCLDVVNGQDVDGTKLQIWACSSNHSPNQQFYYTGDYRLAWTNHGKCTDLPNGNLTDGNRLQIWSCGSGNPNQVWNTGYSASALPHKSEIGQTGINNCGKSSSQSSSCQTAWINDVDDFCLWAPPVIGTIGDTETEEVAWCTKTGRGTRTIPDGTLSGVHFVMTPDYVQVTGQGNFTKINVPKGDEGGELDPHGADGNGNPVGALVFGNSFSPELQYHEWTSFISDTEFCMRACIGPKAAENCQHIYDTMGCFWNMPANYDAGVFESCHGDDDLPMGVYGTSTWFQGVSPTPSPHPVASSSRCRTVPTVAVSPTKKKRDGLIKRHISSAPTPL